MNAPTLEAESEYQSEVNIVAITPACALIPSSKHESALDHVIGYALFAH